MARKNWKKAIEEKADKPEADAIEMREVGAETLATVLAHAEAKDILAGEFRALLAEYEGDTGDDEDDPDV